MVGLLLCLNLFCEVRRPLFSTVVFKIHVRIDHHLESGASEACAGDIILAVQLHAIQNQVKKARGKPCFVVVLDLVPFARLDNLLNSRALHTQEAARYFIRFLQAVLDWPQSGVGIDRLIFVLRRIDPGDNVEIEVDESGDPVRLKKQIGIDPEQMSRSFDAKKFRDQPVTGILNQREAWGESGVDHDAARDAMRARDRETHSVTSTNVAGIRRRRGNHVGVRSH